LRPTRNTPRPGGPVRLPGLSRFEPLVRLSALDDDRRLRILRLLGQKGPLGTPDIIAQLALSQSSASRHLEQLTATGYPTVPRRWGMKRYRLNPDRIEHTFKALTRLLL
jgi:DNA-binding transcriptional ArsR family regulator